MVIKKMVKYARAKGLMPLIIKLRERLKYKLEAMAYTKKNILTNKELKEQKQVRYKNKTIISICVPLYNTKKEFLQDMLDSVINQSYPYWELCLADGSTKDYAYIEAIVKGIGDCRIKYKKLVTNLGLVGNSNEAVSMATGEYIALLDHDDILSKDALYQVKKEIDMGADYIYSDEASFIKSIYKPSIIHFKPDYSIFNLRGNNYICHLSVFTKSNFKAVGGFRQGFDGSQDHDLILRLCEVSKKIVHIPKVLYYWRMHEDSVAMDISAKNYCLTTGVRAVQSHLDRNLLLAEADLAVENAAVYKVRYKTNIKPTIINNIENIKGVTSEYIIVAKSELTVTAKALNEICQVLNQENVGIVGGMVVKDGRIKHSYLKKKGSKYIAEYENAYAISEGYMKRLKYVSACDALPYQFFGIRKSVLESMGYFNDELWEDKKVIDMCKRLKENKYEVLFNPYAVVTKA